MMAAVLVVATTASAWLVGAGESAPDPSAGSRQQAAVPSPPRGSFAVGPASVDPLLLPNLRSLPAEDVGIYPTPTGRELRFAGVLANLGAGPLEVAPNDDPGCPPGQRASTQTIYRDSNRSGRYEQGLDLTPHLRSTGCMLDHPTHQHWHFDASARYVLTDPRWDMVIVERAKVSFCLRDSRRLEASTTTPHTTPQWYDDCERDDIQGISPGWADVYKSELPGQRLELPADLPDGLYCLRIEADPGGLLRESDETDNASVRAIQITGSEVAIAGTGECEPGPAAAALAGRHSSAT